MEPTAVLADFEAAKARWRAARMPGPLDQQL